MMKLGGLGGSGTLGATAVLAIACTRVSEHQRFEPRDDLLEIVETVPPRGSIDVPPDVQLDLCFSSFVDPRAVLDAPVTSGAVQVDAERSLQLSPWRGPGGAPTGDAPWCEGSVLTVAPRTALMPGLLYRSRLAASLRGWNGEVLDTSGPGWTAEADGPRFYLEFTVAPEQADGPGSAGESSSDDGGSSDDGESTGGDPPGADDPTLEDLFAPGAIFDPQRATCSCHRGDDALATARLDLHDPGFPMVSLRRPSESFLVHKLLREPDGDALRGVLGDPMPKDGELPYADYVALARWIEAGALR
jgi:hypothetical protein